MDHQQIPLETEKKITPMNEWQRKLFNLFPFLQVTQTQHPTDFIKDILAGLILSVVLIPEGIAYASLAGLPPLIGIFTVTIPLLIYALIGPSKQLVVANVALISMMVGEFLSLHKLNPEQYLTYAILLSLMNGFFIFFLGVLRAGFLENFISHSVLMGFTAAAALIIASTQLKHLVGIYLPPGESTPNVFYTFYVIFSRFQDWNWTSLVIGVSGIVVILLCRRLTPVLPGPLFNILLGIGIMHTMGNLMGGNVETIGKIQGSLPYFVFPDFSKFELATSSSISFDKLTFEALIIGLVSCLETLTICKIMAAKNRTRIKANRELIALGLANMSSAFFQCYPSSGSLSKTSTSYMAGTKSQLASLTAVGMGFITLAFFTSYLALVPRACLAAIVLVAVSYLIDIRAIIRAFRIKKSDGFIISFTFFSTLSWGIEIGILLGLITSFIIIIWQTSRPRISFLERIGEKEPIFSEVKGLAGRKEKDIIIIKIEGPLYFLSANQLETTIINLLADDLDIKTVILDASAITDLDTSGEEMLWTILRLLMLRQVYLILAGVTKPVMEIMQRSNFHDFLEAINFFPSVREALVAVDQQKSMAVRCDFVM